MMPLPFALLLPLVPIPQPMPHQEPQGEAKVVLERAAGQPPFRFATVPVPARADAAAAAMFTLLDGRADRNGAGLEVLHDGALPRHEDEPRANFFFGGDGGRLGVDLGKVTAVQQVCSYSWHPNTRSAQVYRLYGADGTAAGFEAAPKRPRDPRQCGWRLLASVDTRPANGQAGGQHGVSIGGADAGLGSIRYLLFDVTPTETDDGAGNTFYSEIDVRAAADAARPPAPISARTQDGAVEILIDATAAPELHQWADDELMPVLLQWYPQIVAMLPSDGYSAPKQVHIVFEQPGRGVAATGGDRITCAAAWFAANRRGEAIGALVHELVHVVQQYRGRRSARPGWLVEGIADYIRWFSFEPEAHGAQVRDPAKARYDGSYRVTAQFLDWASRHHDAELVRKLNAALRDGSYDEALWQQLCGQPLAALGEAWKASLAPPPGVDELTEAERQAGWQLLFNGRDFAGWHSFKQHRVLPGWQIEGGAITCADPHNAGDLCTDAQYGAFELVLDYNIASGGNSGIMFHVTDAGGATWATGPECQLLDNAAGKDPQKAGWLYGLYRTDTDATHPAGEWNHLRLLITPQKCEHEINGVVYFDYVLHSDDFEQRLAKSKFAGMPQFARFDRGYIALQGDHGLISFRNIKIRPIAAEK